MYWILDQSVKLKKWKGPQCFYQLDGEGSSNPVPERVYGLLKSCDAKTNLAPEEILEIFERRGMIRPCRKGEAALQPGQVTEYANYPFKVIDWAVTDRCNCNCLHCFHAADNDIRRDEFSREEASAFLKNAADCGIRTIRITGGEPTLYPYLRAVIQEIRERGMELGDLVTNGALVDESLAAFIHKLHPNARMFLSFDGIGTHDWLRQRPGSEEQVKNAIRISRAAGMTVKINMNVNRRNRGVIAESVKMLAEMGAGPVRIIRTTEAPRWALNAENNSLSLEEYFDFALDFAQQYKKYGLRLPVYIWQCLALNGRRNSFSILTEKQCVGKDWEDASLCHIWPQKFSVQANGEIMNCEPMGGWYELYGISMGNVKRDRLEKLLAEGPLVDYVKLTVKQKREACAKCAACPYFERCHGGCPVLSILTNQSPLAPDQFKCAFFENGYYERYLDAKRKWENDGV